MRVTITAPQIGSGTAFTLCDDTVSIVPGTSWPSGAGGVCREGFLPKQTRQIQSSALFRAAYQLFIPRYNLKNRLQFTVQRSFNSTELCVAFCASHPDLVPSQGELWMYHIDGQGTISRYLPNAVSESIECTKQEAAYCEFTYVLWGNGPWQTTT